MHNLCTLSLQSCTLLRKRNYKNYTIAKSSTFEILRFLAMASSDVCAEIMWYVSRLCENNYFNTCFRLEIECAELKDTIKKQASRIEQLQRHLLSTNLVSQCLNFCHTAKGFLSLL